MCYLTIITIVYITHAYTYYKNHAVHRIVCKCGQMKRTPGLTAYIPIFLNLPACLEVLVGGLPVLAMIRSQTQQTHRP